MLSKEQIQCLSTMGIPHWQVKQKENTPPATVETQKPKESEAIREEDKPYKCLLKRGKYTIATAIVGNKPEKDELIFLKKICAAINTMPCDWSNEISEVFEDIPLLNFGVKKITKPHVELFTLSELKNSREKKAIVWKRIKHLK